MGSSEAYYVQLNKENILLKTTQEDIMEKYLGLKVEKDKTYTNPLRSDDTEPGCKFWYNRAGKLYFNDFAGGFMWDCFAVVQRKYGLSFWDALLKINKDLKLGLNGITTLDPIKPDSKTKVVQKRKTIQSIPTV